MVKTAFFSVFTGSIDAAAGVIRGVAVVTEGEAKGHGVLIDAKTLETVKASAEGFKDGVRVKADHGTGFSSIVGALKSFRIEGGKLLADLHLLKSHAMFDAIMEMAQAMPGSVGLSISYSGTDETIDGNKFARCLELYSVDFVDQPAANPSGLFSASVDSTKKGMADTLIASFKEYFSFSRELAAPVVELEAKLKAKDMELTDARKSVTELTAKVTELQAQATGHADELKKLELSVEERASKKALDISAGQGIPPKVAIPTSEPAAAPKKPELKGFAAVQASIRAELAAQGIDQTKLSAITR